MNNKQQIKKRIQQIELQIKKISLHPTKTDISEDLCNSLILQKAILKKELEDLGKNKFVEGIKRMLPKKEKLICDYFN